VCFAALAEEASEGTCSAEDETCVPPEADAPASTTTTTTTMTQFKRASGSSNPFHSGARDVIFPFDVERPPAGSLVDQEIEMLEAVLRQKKAKIALLEQLEGMVSLTEEMSAAQRLLLADQAPDIAAVVGSGGAIPESSPRDFLHHVATIPPRVEDPATLVELVAVGSRSAETQIDLPRAVALTVSPSGNCTVSTATGSMLLETDLGHSADILRLATASTADETLVLSLDAKGLMRTHKLQLTPAKSDKGDRDARRATKDDILSRYLHVKPQATLTLDREFKLPSKGQQRRITDIGIARLGGPTYVLAADDEGGITAFYRNGTRKGRAIATTDEGGVLALLPTPSAVIFHSSQRFGFVSGKALDVKPVLCEEAQNISSIAVDASFPHRLMVASTTGVIQALNVKNKSECVAEQTFPPIGSGPVRLEAFRGYTLAFQRGVEHPKMFAFNTTSSKGGALLPVSVVFESQAAGKADVSAIRRSSTEGGDTLGLLHLDGTLEVQKVLWKTFTQPVDDSFDFYRWPILGLAIVLVIGYQYWKFNSGSSSDSKASADEDLDNVDWKKLAEETRARAAARKQQKSQAASD